jgi:TetR/AcrR family transcriptional regulator
MVESRNRPVRSRDAQKTREIILDAAETIFAEQGFDGARISAIAKLSRYNSSLLFQYFTDKIGLYLAVLKRTDQELNDLLELVLTPWLSGGKDNLDAQALEAFLQTLVQTTFDYLIDHPKFLHILTWEMAGGWKTYMQIASQFEAGENEAIVTLFRSAYDAGLIRSDYYPVLQLTLILHLCQAFCISLPLYQMILAGELSSPAALARAREYITGFVVSGIMSHPPGKNK